MKSNQIFFNFLLLFVGLLLGFLIFGCFYSCFLDFRYPSNFLEIKLNDVIEIFVNVVLAVFISSYLAAKLSYDSRKKELFLGVLERLQSDVNDAHLNGLDYMRGGLKENLVKDIQSSIGKAQISLSLITYSADRVFDCKKHNQDLDNLKNYFLDFKKNLTDSPFGTTKHNYDDVRIRKADSCYQNINVGIHELKLNLFDN